jgi:hypothetical protein
VSSYARLCIRSAEVFSWQNEVRYDDVYRLPISPDEIWDETVRHYIVLISTARIRGGWERSLQPLRRHRGLCATRRGVDPGIDVLHATRHT